MPSKRKKVNINRNNLLRGGNRIHIYLLIVFTIFGFLLRFEPVIHDTVHFSYDQGDDLVEVRQLLIDRKFSLIGRASGMEGVFMGPLWTFLLAIPYALSGGNPSANVILFAILGIFSIWWTYWIVKKIISESAGIISAFYVSFSSAFVGASHIVLSPLPIVMLMIIYIWLLWEIIEQRKINYFPWLGLLVGIFFQLEIAFALFMVPATILTITAFRKFNYLKTRQALLGTILFLITFLPQILFDFRHDFLMSRAISSYFTGENTSLGREEQALLGRLYSRSESLWEDFSQTITFNIDSLRILITVSLPAILGWLLIIKKRKKEILRLGLMLLLIVAILYGSLSLYPGPVWVWYRAGMPIVFILLITLGWVELFKKSSLWKWTSLVIGVYFIVVGVIPRTHTADVYSGKESGPATLKAQKQAINLIYNQAGQAAFDLYIYTPPVYTYVWDHILFWYANPKYKNQPADYGYMRDPEAFNDFYLLIEPDYYETRIDGWKGNFMSLGEKMEEYKLPSGIIIEKWKANKSI